MSISFLCLGIWTRSLQAVTCAVHQSTFTLGTDSCRLQSATSSQAAAAPSFHHTGSCRLPHRLLQVTTEDRGCNIFSGSSCTKFPLPHRFLQVSTEALAGYHAGYCRLPQRTGAATSSQAAAALNFRYHTGSCRLPHRLLQVTTQALAGYHRGQRLQHLLRQQLHQVSTTTQVLAGYRAVRAGYHTGSCRHGWQVKSIGMVRLPVGRCSSFFM
jgi:hypothetical protein